MVSSTSGISPEPFLLYSYTAYRKEVPVILELWGSEERINKGVVKDLSGKQLSVISEASILGGKDQSITGSALLAYLKTTKLSAVLYIQGNEEIAWLLPTFASLEEQGASSQNLLGGDFCEIIRQNCRTKEDLNVFGARLFSIGAQLYQYSRFVDAIIWFTRALFIHLLLGDKRNAGGCYGNLGNAYHFLGDFRKAIDSYKEQLKLTKELGNLKEEGSAYSTLGNSYFSLGDFRQAIEYFEMGLKIAKEKGDHECLRGTYVSLGNAYCSLRDYHKAIKSYKKRATCKIR